MRNIKGINWVIYYLGFLGFFTFFIALAHDFLGIHYQSPKLGLVDIFIALLGVTLMIPAIIVFFRPRPVVLYLGILGLFIFSGALLHDALGVFFSFHTVIGRLDIFVSLLGIVLMAPLLFLLFKPQERHRTYLALSGLLIFFGALIHDALPFSPGINPNMGWLDRILSSFGVVLMLLYIIVMAHLNQQRRQQFSVFGIAIFLFALLHDAVGITFSHYSGIGLFDIFLALCGLVLLVPYILSLPQGKIKIR